MRTERMDFPHVVLTDLEALIAKIAGVLAGVFGLWKSIRIVWRKWKQLWRFMERFTGSVDAFDNMADAFFLLQSRAAMANEMSPTPMFQADAHGRVTGANAALQSLFSLPLVKIMGSGWEQVILQADRRDVVQAWDEAIREKTDFNRVFWIQPNGGGARQRIEIWARPVINRKNEVVEFQGSVKILPGQRRLNPEEK